MLIRTCLTFWSTVISYKKAISLDQNKLVLHTKIRKHCASMTCLNGSQIFELGTAVTLGVYLGPPCRLVCTRVIENCVWHGGGGAGCSHGLWHILWALVGLLLVRLSTYTCVHGVCWLEVLQAVLVGEPCPFTEPLQSLTMLRRFSLWLFLLWGFWALGEAKKRVTAKVVTRITQ